MRRCAPTDAGELARLLDAFNLEYGDPSPGIYVLEKRVASMIASGELSALMVGDPAVGVAVVRYRQSIWYEGLEAYLAELYIEPESRGRGLGRALLQAVIDDARIAGAGIIELGTSVDDTAARGLYERMGFTNFEGGPDGPSMLFYELEL